MNSDVMSHDEKIAFIQDALEKGLKGLEEMTTVLRDMSDCLEDMTNHYAELANSGDCGFWDPEKESEVVAARKMIADVREGLASLP